MSTRNKIILEFKSTNFTSDIFLNSSCYATSILIHICKQILNNA